MVPCTSVYFLALVLYVISHTFLFCQRKSGLIHGLLPYILTLVCWSTQWSSDPKSFSEKHYAFLYIKVVLCQSDASLCYIHLFIWKFELILCSFLLIAWFICVKPRRCLLNFVYFWNMFFLSSSDTKKFHFMPIPNLLFSLAAKFY